MYVCIWNQTITTKFPTTAGRIYPAIVKLQRERFEIVHEKGLGPMYVEDNARPGTSCSFHFLLFFFVIFIFYFFIDSCSAFEMTTLTKGALTSNDA